MSENVESFKEAFRQSQWCADMRGIKGMSDPEIFELAASGRTFYKVQTNDAWRIWRLASIRAARIVIQATGIPPGARNPTRDHIVLMGESIRDQILHGSTVDSPDRSRFEALFRETQEYRIHVELGHDKMADIFDRHPEEGWYYHPAVSLAWKFYQLGAQ